MELEEKCKLCDELSKNTILISYKLLGKDLFNVVENISGIQLRALYPRVDELVLCQKCALGLIQAESMVEKIRRVLSNLPVGTKEPVTFSTPQNIKKRKETSSPVKVSPAAKKPKPTTNTPIKQTNGTKQVESSPKASEQKINNKTNAKPKTPTQKPMENGTSDVSADATSTKNKLATPKNELHKLIEDSLITVEETVISESSSNTSLDVSQNSKAKDITTNFDCEHCSYVTKSVKLFRTHLITKHDIEKPRIFKCNQCSEAYQRQHLLQQHILYVHEHKPRPRNFACTECDKMFFHRGALQSHAKTHTSEASTSPQKLNCSEDNCSETFNSEAALNAHKSSAHKPPPSTPTKVNITKESSTPKKHKCTTCDKTFSKAEKLQAHVDECHTESQLNECPKCQLTFLSKQKYEEHCANDDCYPEKQFPCKFPQCGKRFNSAKKMLAHMEKRHIDSD